MRASLYHVTNFINVCVCVCVRVRGHVKYVRCVHGTAWCVRAQTCTALDATQVNFTASTLDGEALPFGVRVDPQYPFQRECVDVM
jgi:hypothetical protein